MLKAISKQIRFIHDAQTQSKSLIASEMPWCNINNRSTKEVIEASQDSSKDSTHHLFMEKLIQFVYAALQQIIKIWMSWLSDLI